MRDFAEYLAGCGKKVVKDEVVCLQMNLGYACNLSCNHCHVQAGPHRTEMMSRKVIDDCLAFVERAAVKTVDITGGAPELNPHLRHLVQGLRLRASVEGVTVRSNLTLLCQPQYEDLPGFFADNGVDIVASLPCYLEDNVRGQRGDGVYPRSIDTLKMLNSIGYGTNGRRLDLVYNPAGGFLPGPQPALEAAYREELAGRYGIAFDSLYTIANMPVGRFRDDLERGGKLEGYLELLAQSFNPETVDKLMCRRQVNVDWQGRIYDCDFNQVLGLQVKASGCCIGEATMEELFTTPVTVGQHCFACTAGAGSSCRGSLSN